MSVSRVQSRNKNEFSIDNNSSVQVNLKEDLNAQRPKKLPSDEVLHQRLRNVQQ